MTAASSDSRTAMSKMPTWFKLPQAFRFLITGGINTVFGYACYAALLYVGLHYVWAALFGTVLAVLFNYLTTSQLVFRADIARPKQLMLFCASYAGLYFVNIFFLWRLELLGFDPYLSGLIIILPMAAISFFVLKLLVFPSSQ